MSGLPALGTFTFPSNPLPGNNGGHLGNLTFPTGSSSTGGFTNLPSLPSNQPPLNVAVPTESTARLDETLKELMDSFTVTLIEHYAANLPRYGFNVSREILYDIRGIPMKTAVVQTGVKTIASGSRTKTWNVQPVAGCCNQLNQAKKGGANVGKYCPNTAGANGGMCGTCAKRAASSKSNAATATSLSSKAPLTNFNSTMTNALPTGPVSNIPLEDYGMNNGTYRVRDTDLIVSKPGITGRVNLLGRFVNGKVEAVGTITPEDQQIIDIYQISHSASTMPALGSKLPAIGNATTMPVSTLPAIGSASKLPALGSTLPALGNPATMPVSTLPAIGSASKLPALGSTLPALGNPTPMPVSTLPAIGSASKLPALGNPITMPVIKTPSIVPEPQPESEEQPNEPSEPQPESEPEPQSEEPSEEQVEQPEESVQSKPPFGGVSVFPKLTIPGSLPQLGSLTTKLPVGAPTTGPSLPKLQVGTLPSIGGGFLKPMTGAI